MSTWLIRIATLAFVSINLIGCAANSTPTASTTSTRPYLDTEKKVYSKEELDKRGRQTPGEALAAQDPSITVTGRH